DGIRDRNVTGVQTCALPIYSNRGARWVRRPAPETRRQRRRMVASQLGGRGIHDCRVLAAMAWVPREWFLPPHLASEAYEDAPLQIGRASCRERGKGWGLEGR